MVLDLRTEQVPLARAVSGTRIAITLISRYSCTYWSIHMTIPAPSPLRPDLPPDVTPKLPLPPDVNPDMPQTPLNDPLPPLAPPSIIADGAR